MLQLKEDKISKLGVKNKLEEKEHIIMRDVKLATIMQHQEVEKAHTSMEKEQRSMTSTPTGKDLLLVWSILSLHSFIQPSIPNNLSIASKVTNLTMDSKSFFADCLLHLQAVFKVTRKNSTVDMGYHYTNSS